MTLVDATPLIALLNTRDPNYATSRETLMKLPPPLHTTWPVITEAMYFLHKYVGWAGQHALWQMMQKNQVVVVNLDEAMTSRAFNLMEKYRDVPMDLADATLVALAEHLDTKIVFTLDSDFRVYRFKNRQAFKVVPD